LTAAVFYYFMRSLYASNALTRQGEQTRSEILATLKQQDGLTRMEIVSASGLTYEQVRNQTENLILDGKIHSKNELSQRRYYLGKSKSSIHLN
jgi:predicted ArsR family transcriptional regulator